MVLGAYPSYIDGGQRILSISAGEGCVCVCDIPRSAILLVMMVRCVVHLVNIDYGYSYYDSTSVLHDYPPLRGGGGVCDLLS